MPPRFLLMVRLTCVVAAGAVALASLSGCASRAPRQRPADYQTVDDEPRRQTDLARRENERGVDLLSRGDWAGAERAFRAALEADVMSGPAHNNLGKAYFHQRKLYLAAWEFQYAAKLMPHQPEPLNNLGLVFEAAGKLDEAVESYGKARELEPDNPQFLGNLARARVRRGDRDEDLRGLLGDLALRDTRPEWQAWARRSLSRLSAVRPGPAGDAGAADGAQRRESDIDSE